MDLNDIVLADVPQQLAHHYTRAAVSNHLTLTGHSFQSSPDCSFHGLQLACRDAHEHIDDQCNYALNMANRVRRGYSELLNANHNNILLSQNIFELISFFCDTIKFKNKIKIIATDNESRQIELQLHEIQKLGAEIIRVNSTPCDTFIERYTAAIDHNTSIAILPRTHQSTAYVIDDLSSISLNCLSHQCELLVDVSHSINLTPININQSVLRHHYIIGTGHKYCQLGEGCCFMHLPDHCTERPIVTGWFQQPDYVREQHRITIQDTVGRFRFVGDIHDPACFYRAAEVFDFFKRQNLTASLLNKLNRAQLDTLSNRIELADFSDRVLTPVNPTNQNGGFLSYSSHYSKKLQHLLSVKGVQCDTIDHNIRFGPAPYTSLHQIHQSVDILEHVVKHLL